ncbi:MAG: transcription termination/antitermination protein NusA [Anaerolineae bacterium]|nr:transcription termination/antitermination protein NusA [Anaerolineae bacterium]
MRSDFMLAINQLCAERKLSPDVVLEAVEAALISAYKRNYGAMMNVEVHIEPETGGVKVFAAKEVVDKVTDPKVEVSVADAREVEPGAVLGDTVMIESTPRDFGRIAAQLAKQVILQRIREAERDALYSSFADSTGEIALGTVQSYDYHSGDVVVNLDGAEAILPEREQVSTERYRRGSRIRAYVLDVRKGSRGPHITLSRRSPLLLRRLLELEVPEIFNGAVEIKAIAREAGSRSKVAVHAVQEGVDPVGSCVGVRGGRIQNIVSELNGEKIDVVQWNTEVGVFIANSLSPAKVMNVLLADDPDVGKTATVIVPDRQLSLAIGKEGQNARLAAKLTGWRIDIKSATEAAEETLGRLEDIHVPQDQMDLLTLAESLLQKQDADGFSTDQRRIIAAAVEPDLPIDWPPSEPVEARLKEEGEPSVGDTEVPTPEAIAEPVMEGKPELVAEAQPEEQRTPTLPALEAEIDQEPPFEGEPVSDSIGWVRTEPEVDYYSGWADGEEEEPEDFDIEAEWVRDEPEEEPDYKRGKKKKGKRRPRRDYYGEDDLNLGGGGRPPRGGRPRTR